MMDGSYQKQMAHVRLFVEMESWLELKNAMMATPLIMMDVLLHALLKIVM